MKNILCIAAIIILMLSLTACEDSWNREMQETAVEHAIQVAQSRTFIPYELESVSYDAENSYFTVYVRPQADFDGEIIRIVLRLYEDGGVRIIEGGFGS